MKTSEHARKLSYMLIYIERLSFVHMDWKNQYFENDNPLKNNLHLLIFYKDSKNTHQREHTSSIVSG